MSIPSPFALLQGFVQKLRFPTPPAWAVEEAQRKCILVLNHVLMQEPEAMQRLVRQSGRTILAQWRSFSFAVRVTPAGLLDVASDGATPDLTLVLTEESPWVLAQTLAQSEKPPVRIEGDVQLAAEVNWLADNVRWDVEEDLSRVIGDAPAHLLMDTGRKVSRALMDFVGKKRKSASGSDHGATAA